MRRMLNVMLCCFDAKESPLAERFMYLCIYLFIICMVNLCKGCSGEKSGSFLTEKLRHCIFHT